MSYSVIYLDGTNKLPFKECEVCKKINRNVIEPVAVFVPKSQEKESKAKIYKNAKRFSNYPENFTTCIFHCEKENEIWMENFNDGYEEYTKRRDEAINKKEPFDENFEIKWNEFLVEEFWKRIRAYRFAIDYIELWEKTNKNWNKFLEELKNIKFVPLKYELEKNKDLFLFNFKYLSNFYNYNFEKFIFPEFIMSNFYSSYKISNKYKDKILQSNNILSDNCNFFFAREKIEFKKNVNFNYAKFYDVTEFSNISFLNELNFTWSKFFKGAYFDKITFQKSVQFSRAEFYKWVSFSSAKFLSNANFWDTLFLSRTKINCVFQNEVSFSKAIFKGNTKFYLSGKNLIFDLSNINLYDKTKIEIHNLKTINLILENINNVTDYFFFYNTDIITLKDNYKESLKENMGKEIIIDRLKTEPNLTIKNSHFNKMKFINFDLSKAKNINIENSDLTEVKFINTEWGEISEKRICPNLFEKEPKKARETYRQLKYALDNQKDHINANEFFSLEMKAYGKSLKWNNWQDKIIFTINKWTSDFGQSWVKPLLWIFILTFIMSLYLHYKEINLQLIFNGNGGLNWSIIGSSFIMMIENFFSTLNIFKIFGNSNNNHSNIFCYHTITSIYTILLAFFIYQFIIAVKRKTKR